MTNTLVGDVYAKIIEEVVHASQNDFEESGVGSTTLGELQQEWQAKLSQRSVAQMPWDPKPQPAQPAPQQLQPQPSSASHPSATAQYQSYDGQQTNGTLVKQEPDAEKPFNPLPNGYPSNGQGSGGLLRAQQLVQEQYGNAGAATINAMQQRGGLALPAQQKQQTSQISGSSSSQAQQNFQQKQQAAMARQQQQQQLAQQQAQPRVKVENESPQLQQGQIQQRQPTYGQTDGADEGLDEWRAMLSERRAQHAQQAHVADRVMHDQIMKLSENLQSGLMLPLSEHRSRKSKRSRSALRSSKLAPLPSRAPEIPQLDGDVDDEDGKADSKDDEDDENAINSDLDDSDEEAGGAMGDDEDEMGDSILCTYDKVQRVKNKWKCTLKDGVMSVGGKEWVFHKGMGEFEW